jgi:hypothetical protein
MISGESVSRPVSWRKSSWSAYNGSCVEFAELEHGRVGVRDTKANGSGPVLVFTHAEWKLFLASVKSGDLDLGNSIPSGALIR